MITVFTSSYNYSRYLRRAIESVLNQTYRDFEYHLIDYGSTDDTWKIINEYKDERIKAIQLDYKPRNAYAVNYSMRLALGDYWAWCPADDYWTTDLLERKIDYAQRYPKAVLYDDFYLINDNNQEVGLSTLEDLTPEKIKEEIWKRSLIGFTGIFIPSYVYKELGLYFPYHVISDDFYWMIRATIFNVPFVRVPERLHYKRTHAASMVNRNYDEVIKGMSLIWEELKYEKNIS